MTGWGHLRYGGPGPDRLQKVTVPVLSNQECNELNGGMVTDSMICAGSPEKDACQGDLDQLISQVRLEI